MDLEILKQIANGNLGEIYVLTEIKLNCGEAAFED